MMSDTDIQLGPVTVMEFPDTGTYNRCGSQVSIISSNPESVSQPNRLRKWYKTLFCVVVFLILTTIIASTIYYLSKVTNLGSKKSSHENCFPIIKASEMQRQNGTDNTGNYNSTNTCTFSPEAKRIKLDLFLAKLSNSYYRFFPQNIIFKRGISSYEIKTLYRPFDSRPSAIKQKTDAAKNLLRELNLVTENCNEDALKERERKGIYEARQVLKHAFSAPYAGNYYNGDWLLGPDSFCWQEICYLFYYFPIGLYKPMTLEEVEKLGTLLRQFEETILQYIDNLKTGVRSGMVRSIEACNAGLNAFKRAYPWVIHHETGIRQNYKAAVILDPSYIEYISNTSRIAWLQSHGETLAQSLDRFVVEYLGRPLHTLISYLEHDYMRHCVPSNVSSGLANLPLPYVHVDGKADKSQPTNRTLPTGEVIQGPVIYRGIMSFFTTTSSTPSEITKQAKTLLDQLYRQAVVIAKKITGMGNEKNAVKAFRRLITSRKMYFNQEPFPENESNENAFLKCTNVAAAQVFCPKRWKAMQKWIKSATETMGLVSGKINQSLFYNTGRKKTLPNCLVEVIPDFNPSVSYHHYAPCYARHPTKAIHYLPFFIDNYGPRYAEWTTTAHETIPGHHVEVQGYAENFRDHCSDELTWLETLSYFASFSEGWATYAESRIIAKDTDSYFNDTMSKYGMINHQIMAMLRTIIDIGLHSKGMTREEALRLFDLYAWETSDLASKEVTRYQSSPGQALAYSVGQSAIVKARELSESCLGKTFSLPEFHYQILHQGEVPLEYLERNIKKYIKLLIK